MQRKDSTPGPVFSFVLERMRELQRQLQKRPEDPELQRQWIVVRRVVARMRAVQRTRKRFVG